MVVEAELRSRSPVKPYMDNQAKPKIQFLLQENETKCDAIINS